MKKYRLIGLFALFCLLAAVVYSSTEERPRPGNANGKFVMPLLRECELFTIDRLIEMRDRLEVSFEVSVLGSDVDLPSHPNFTGVLILESSELTKTELRRIANGPLIDCYPMQAVKVSLGDSNLADEISNLRKLSALEGVTELYPVLARDHISFFFQAGPLAEVIDCGSDCPYMDDSE